MFEEILIFVLVGFTAQIIDGALGMAYGVSSSTFLLSLGIPPAAASASVHTAEIFTSGVSGLSHLKLGNVDKELFKSLLLPGIIGGVAGAYILTAIPGDVIKPFVSAYLLIMGVVILIKAIQGPSEKRPATRIFPLALFGGLLDAAGGGGWGPIVTTTLVANGGNPRYTVGSVNLSEFFVTVSEVIAFLTVIGLSNWKIILGLLIGGVAAAPLAAIVCKRLPTRALMILIGLLIVGLSARTIYLALAPLLG